MKIGNSGNRSEQLLDDGIFLEKWADPGLFLVFYVRFEAQFLQEKLQALEGFELRLSEYKASTLTKWPPLK